MKSDKKTGPDKMRYKGTKKKSNLQIYLHFFYLKMSFAPKCAKMEDFLRIYLHLLNFFCKFAGYFSVRVCQREQAYTRMY